MSVNLRQIFEIIDTWGWRDCHFLRNPSLLLALLHYSAACLEISGFKSGKDTYNQYACSHREKKLPCLLLNLENISRTKVSSLTFVVF